MRASRQPILAHFSTAEESRILQTVERKVEPDFINGRKSHAARRQETWTIGRSNVPFLLVPGIHLLTKKTVLQILIKEKAVEASGPYIF